MVRDIPGRDLLRTHEDYVEGRKSFIPQQIWAMLRLRGAALPPYGPSRSSASWAKPAAAIAGALGDHRGLFAGTLMFWAIFLIRGGVA